ncbi:MAG: hypothetical protein WD276_04015 [Actinomycetota bacterium]
MSSQVRNRGIRELVADVISAKHALDAKVTQQLGLQSVSYDAEFPTQADSVIDSMNALLQAIEAKVRDFD